jgi:hypothetical protein
MKRSLWMLLLAATMTMTAVAFAAKSPFARKSVGGCNSVCRTDSDCTNPRCPVCAIFYKNGVTSSALCHAFGAK